jgi:hypothetical protein
MPIHDTPWGPRSVTSTDDSVDKIVLDMWADHEEKMSDIAYYCADLIAEHENSSMSTLDLVEWFMDVDDKTYKQMNAFVKKVIKSQKDQVKEYVRLGVEIQAECKKLRGKTMDQKRDAEAFLMALRVTPFIEELEVNIKKNEQILMLAGKTPEGEPSNQGLDFERAKLVPIDSLLQFTRGFAPCCWHNENTPSMKYYKKNNRVHCFGCGKGGDAIDVIQTIKDCDIKTAVQFLTA